MVFEFVVLPQLLGEKKAVADRGFGTMGVRQNRKVERGYRLSSPASHFRLQQMMQKGRLLTCGLDGRRPAGCCLFTFWTIG